MFKFLLLSVLPAAVSAHPAAANDQAPPPEGGGDPFNGAQGAPVVPESSNWVGAPNTPITKPSLDPFYAVNTTLIKDYPHGQCMLERPIGLSATYNGIETAFQIVFSTQDNYDRPTSAVADVLVPLKSKLNGNIIAYQIEQDTVNVDCTPAYSLFYRRTIPAIQSLLNEGYVVVVPDYEGVRNSFTVGKIAGRAILDALSATKERVGQLNVYTKGDFKVGVWGYGTASWASGWAAELAEEYSPDLHLKVAALGGYITNLTNWATSLNGSPSSSLLVSSLIGLSTEYKDVYDVLQSNLAPRRRNFFNSAINHCATENMVRYFDSDVINNYFIPNYNVLADNNVRNVYELNSLGKTAPKCNLFVYQSQKDTNIFDVRKTLKFYCSQGTNIKYHEIASAGRDSTSDMYLDVIDYLGDAFSGNSLSSNCDRINGLQDGN